MIALIPSPFFMDLSAETEGLSLHVIMKCATIFSTLHDKPSHVTYPGVPIPLIYCVPGGLGVHHIQSYMRRLVV